jgi:hypothetical protein
MLATLIGTEVVRSLVHRHRERAYGIGATQDIAMWGTLIGWVFALGAIGCGMMWLVRR